MTTDTPLIPPSFSPDPELLAERIVLITGATGGLGRALAVECARAGARVIVSGRSLEKLEAVCDEIDSVSAHAPALAVLDLATATAVEYDALAQTIADEYGRLDGLVHAAALLGDRTPLEQYDVPMWCRVLHVNLTAPFILTQVLLPSLRRSEDASVLLVSSSIVTRPRPFWGAYAVSKSALEAVRTLLVQELEDTTVRVNSVNPGRMRTAMRAAAYPAEDPNTLPTPQAASTAFLYLLSTQSRAIDGEYIEAQAG